MVSAIQTATISSLDQMITESEQRHVKITEEYDQRVARIAGEKNNLHAAQRRIADPEGIHSMSERIVPLIARPAVTS